MPWIAVGDMDQGEEGVGYDFVGRIEVRGEGVYPRHVRDVIFVVAGGVCCGWCCEGRSLACGCVTSTMRRYVCTLPSYTRSARLEL